MKVAYFPEAQEELEEAVRFPYGIVCQIVNNTLVIVAVMHLHRRPGY